MGEQSLINNLEGGKLRSDVYAGCYPTCTPLPYFLQFPADLKNFGKLLREIILVIFFLGLVRVGSRNTSWNADIYLEEILFFRKRVFLDRLELECFLYSREVLIENLFRARYWFWEIFLYSSPMKIEFSSITLSKSIKDLLFEIRRIRSAFQSSLW